MKINLIRWFGLVLLMMLYLTVQAQPAQIANKMYQQGKSPSYILNALVFKHGVDPLAATKTTTKVVRQNTRGMKRRAMRRQLTNLTVAATFITPDLAPEIVDTVLQDVSVNRLPSNFVPNIALVAMIVVPELAREILTAAITVTDSNPSPVTQPGNSNPQVTNMPNSNNNFFMVTTFMNGFYSGERFPRDWNKGRSQSDLVEEPDDEKPRPQITTGGHEVSPD
jgi:hypothetical protein